MWGFIWDNLMSNVLNWAFGLPWYVWVVPAAVIIGIAVKLYRVAGWQGVLGAIMLVVTIGAYRQGWKDSARRRGPDSFEPIKKKETRTVQSAIKEVFKRQPATGKRRYNRDTNVWEPIDGGN
jgi:hypothetical protein